MRYGLYAIVLLVLPLVSFAGAFPYEDVSSDAWFSDAVESFVRQGYLDSGQQDFRPSDPALRSEFIKLVVELNGGILDEMPESSSFADVSPGDWFFGYVEEAGREGWIKGSGNCYGSGVVCLVKPNEKISRAEAAVIIRRAFGKQRTKKAPAFSDNPVGDWFSEAVQIAADNCILHGDDGTRNVRPHEAVNRAEMAVMLYRVDEGRRYPRC